MSSLESFGFPLSFFSFQEAPRSSSSFIIQASSGEVLPNHVLEIFTKFGEIHIISNVFWMSSRILYISFFSTDDAVMCARSLEENEKLPFEWFSTGDIVHPLKDIFTGESNEAEIFYNDKRSLVVHKPGAKEFSSDEFLKIFGTVLETKLKVKRRDEHTFTASYCDNRDVAKLLKTNESLELTMKLGLLTQKAAMIGTFLYNFFGDGTENLFKLTTATSIGKPCLPDLTSVSHFDSVDECTFGSEVSREGWPVIAMDVAKTMTPASQNVARGCQSVPLNSLVKREVGGFRGPSELEPPGGCTTVMLKNIPNKYTLDMLVNVLDEDFANEFNFVHLPRDSTTRKALGYAFVNICNHSRLQMFFKKFTGRMWPNTQSRKKCEVRFARVQGIDALRENFNNAKLVSMPMEYRPRFVEVHRDDLAASQSLK